MQADVLYCDVAVQVSRLELAAGEECPWHVHHHKCDGLLVYSGVLVLLVDNWAHQYLTAESGAATIPAGMPHRYRALSDVRALQFYRAKPDEDIRTNDVQFLDEKDVARDS